MLFLGGPLSFHFEHGGVTARWAGALHVERRTGGGVLVGAPEGIVERLGRSAVDGLGVVVVPTGRTRDVAGLVSLLAARTRPTPLEVLCLVGEPRATAVIDAFARGWAGRPQPVVDVVSAGRSVHLADVRLDTRAGKAGEPHAGRVEPVTAVGVRVSVDGVRVVWLPSMAPSAGWQAFVGDAHLAAIEIGARAWPSTEGGPWRFDATGAVRAAAGAGELWLVGDDGQPAGGAEA